MDIKAVVVTCCDADTFFHCQHFAELTYNFCTDADRYCRFWQTPIVVRAVLCVCLVLADGQASVT